MSDDEREQWWKLLHSDVWSERDGTIESILDRVQQLERELDVTAALAIELSETKRELAAARAALSESRDAGRKIHRELMAARAEPAKPKPIGETDG